MSAFIGTVKGPRHNSVKDVAEVWCSPACVELSVADIDSGGGIKRTLDPIAARNLAALLVRASEEAERMTKRRATEEQADRTPPGAEPK